MTAGRKSNGKGPNITRARKPTAAQLRAREAFLKRAGHKPNAKRVAKILREWADADAKAAELAETTAAKA